MAADFLVASLQPLVLDGAAPYTMERYLDMCGEQLGGGACAGASFAERIKAIFPDLFDRWADVDAQLRNAIAAERARVRGVDGAKFRRPVRGCSLYLTNRVVQAFQEKDPARRELILDQIRWDAVGELVQPCAPLSKAAAFAYAIRLEMVIRRRSASVAAGNTAFDRLTSASKIEL